VIFFHLGVTVDGHRFQVNGVSGFPGQCLRPLMLFCIIMHSPYEK